jgi:threonine/homoserine/homoserine lactone efflux protein
VLVLRQLPGDALAALSGAGAVFVAWLAWDALHAEPAAEAPKGGDLRRAAIVNALSPHPWLFWLTVGGPLLVDAAADSAWPAAGFLAGFYAALVGAKIAVAVVVDAGRRRHPELGRMTAARVVAAVLLAAVAAVLLYDAVTRLAG